MNRADAVQKRELKKVTDSRTSLIGENEGLIAQLEQMKSARDAEKKKRRVELARLYLENEALPNEVDKLRETCIHRGKKSSGPMSAAEGFQLDDYFVVDSTNSLAVRYFGPDGKVALVKKYVKILGPQCFAGCNIASLRFEAE
jgi:hypothetical protein